MSNKIIFDTGPLISLSMNNLLWILEKLKASFGGDFVITDAVKKECVGRPLETKKFKFEALQILNLLETKVIDLEVAVSSEQILHWLDVANNLFVARDNPIKIVHYAEMEVVMSALEKNCNIVVIDERTTRLLIEDPMKIKKRLEKKLHTKISVNNGNLQLIKDKFKEMKVLRSTELVIAAYELGFLDKFLTKEVTYPRNELLQAVLWGLKLKGCSIREEEIDEMIRFEQVSKK